MFPRRLPLVAAALLAAACAPAAPAPAVAPPAPLGADSASARTVAPGVVHRRLVVNGVPWVINVLEVDLRRGEVEVRAEHAFGRLDGRERTSDLARRVAGDSLELLAAVNADFFSLATGEVLNNQVIEGRLVTGVGRLANARLPRSQFALTRDRRPLIERFVLEGAVQVGADSFALAGVNVPAAREGLVLRRAPAPDTLADTLRDVRAVPLARAGRDTTLFVATGPLAAAAEAEARMPAGGALLVARGATADRLARALGAPGARTPVRVTHALAPARGALRTLAGGWTRLVAEGASVADSAWAHEGAARGFIVGRNPRTGIGFSRDSTTLYLVTVDGRQPRSAGMTIAEFAAIMRGLGAWQAMNFDGGGSTTMVVRDSIVNSPSDSGGERPVGNALVIVRRR